MLSDFFTFVQSSTGWYLTNFPKRSCVTSGHIFLRSSGELYIGYQRENFGSYVGSFLVAAH